MADVLIVCVREDEPQAKALADMFEAAGFSIGGAPSSDAALRSSGAGVVVWSQASIRSRPFLDAAQRVINADKAVVASLIEPPPPSSIGNSTAFDLSRWDGDPNDPALDPLFFAVDRMVNAARSSVGASSPAQDYDPPAAAPTRAPRAAPQPPPAPRARSTETLSDEAAHWRSIRDSRDPADFMDYLARYGADGEFAELAELRLKQLTSADVRPAPAPQRPTPRPQPRAEAPPPRRPDPPPQRRPEPPPRRPDPPPRRAEAPLPPPPRRAPPPDRTYDRELREPPREGGGALRTFILIALLGGAALFGGLYFGGSMSGQGDAPQTENVDPTPPLGEAATGAPPTDYSEDTTPFDETPPRTTAAEPPPREPTPATTTEREREPPPPTTTVATNTTSGGPVPLTPSELASTNQGSTGPSVVVPLSPTGPGPTTTASTTPPSTTETLRGTTGSVVFTQRPSARRITELYPSRALNNGVGGRVQLNCTVRPNLSLACTIASETPSGQGFGEAALSASSAYRVRATRSDGSSAIGTTTRVAVAFQAPQ